MYCIYILVLGELRFMEYYIVFIMTVYFKGHIASIVQLDCNEG